jgi:hypothetical protein
MATDAVLGTTVPDLQAARCRPGLKVRLTPPAAVQQWLSGCFDYAKVRFATACLSATG